MTGNGLQVMCNTNIPPEVGQTVRRMMAIALMPPLRIDQAFQAVKNNAPNVVGMDMMLNYVQNTYIDPVNAQFDRAIWNCYGMADRTTNCCEAYHRVMNERFRPSHDLESVLQVFLWPPVVSIIFSEKNCVEPSCY